MIVPVAVHVLFAASSVVVVIARHDGSLSSGKTRERERTRPAFFSSQRSRLVFSFDVL